MRKPEHSAVMFDRFGLGTFGSNTFLHLSLWRLNVKKQEHHVCSSFRMSPSDWSAVKNEPNLQNPQCVSGEKGPTALHETSLRSLTAMMCWEEIWSERYIIFPWEDFEIKSRTGGQQFNVSVKWHENRTSRFVENKTAFPVKVRLNEHAVLFSCATFR